MEEKNKDWRQNIKAWRNKAGNFIKGRGKSVKEWFKAQPRRKKVVIGVAGALVLAWAVSVIITIFGTLFAALFYWRFPDISSTLEFFGAVLTLVGTVLLGAVTVWQTKKANDIAERADEDARKAQERAHKPLIVISSVRPGEMKKDDLRSARVLRLKKTDWDDHSLSNYDDLVYTDNKKKGKFREDILFLEIKNHSSDSVQIDVDTGNIRQSFPRKGAESEEFKFNREPIESMVLSGNDSAMLVIRDAGRPDRSNDKKDTDKEAKTETSDIDWKRNWFLILPLHVKNLWAEEMQTWEVQYRIDWVEADRGTKDKPYQVYDIASVKPISFPDAAE